MSDHARARVLKIGAMLPIMLLLIGGRTSVAPLPETMVPVATDHAVGSVFTAKEGDVILRAHVYASEVATIDAPVTVSIGKFTHEMTAGMALDPVLAPDKTIKAVNTYSLHKTNPKKMAYPVYFNDILGGAIGVMAADAEKGEAEVKIVRNFKRQWVKPINIVVNYVYVYY